MPSRCFLLFECAALQVWGTWTACKMKREKILARTYSIFEDNLGTARMFWSTRQRQSLFALSFFLICLFFFFFFSFASSSSSNHQGLAPPHRAVESIRTGQEIRHVVRLAVHNDPARLGAGVLSHVAAFQGHVGPAPPPPPSWKTTAWRGKRVGAKSSAMRARPGR